jgi:transglutaminase-like putative cysteine protease
VRAWIPIPPTDRFQEIENLKVIPAAGPARQEALHGNRVITLEWSRPFAMPLEAVVSFDLLRREEVPHSEPISPEARKRLLKPDRLGIIDKRILDLAAKATAGRTGTLAKARGIYDHVLQHMAYDKETPGWGRGDTARACDVGKGNCSDYHALFISMARASGIPARFHYGYSLKPGGEAGAHCWAEFLDEKLGWVPVDISEADKDPSRTDYYFGRLSENRILMTTGRDIILDPPQQGEPLNFFITPYVEVDGRPHEQLTCIARHRPLEG